MSNYRKTMTEALREMYSLDESVIDKVKEIDRKKSAKKIDGVTYTRDEFSYALLPIDLLTDPIRTGEFHRRQLNDVYRVQMNI